MDEPRTTLSDGSPVTADHAEIGPGGQQKGYVVLADVERAKGFVRPVRRSYRHVGPPAPKFPLRDLTAEERERFGDDYVKYEKYENSKSSALGRFYTQADLDAIAKGGCGTVTTMGLSIAETYAREPGFYCGTFCCGCGKHLPVGKQGEFVWEGTDERVGT